MTIIDKEPTMKDALIEAGLTEYIGSLSDLIQINLASRAMLENVIEFALLAGYERGQAKGTYGELTRITW